MFVITVTSLLHWQTKQCYQWNTPHKILSITCATCNMGHGGNTDNNLSTFIRGNEYNQGVIVATADYETDERIKGTLPHLGNGKVSFGFDPTKQGVEALKKFNQKADHGGLIDGTKLAMKYGCCVRTLQKCLYHIIQTYRVQFFARKTLRYLEG